MKTIQFIAAAMVATLSLSTAVIAQDIMVKDAYVRSSTPTSKTGAAFFHLMNGTGEDDRLIEVRSTAAPRVELHTHTEDANGVMRMGEIEGGVELPAGEMHMFKRGGDHLMFMGMTQPLEQGSAITVTLTFEKAGDVTVQIPVDHERKPNHGGMKHD